jgi:hypothetical protein
MKAPEPRIHSRYAERPARGFTSISIPKYVKLHVASNPSTNVKELAQQLQQVLEAKLAGARCQCGEPIWVIGSVQVGLSCFTCITGDAVPENDYEVVNEHDG